MNHKDKFVAYDADSGYETFETFDEAQAWLREMNDDGLSDEAIEGYSYIAAITHRTAVEIVDRRSEYEEEALEWPYSDEWEWVGKLIFVPVEVGEDAR